MGQKAFIFLAIIIISFCIYILGKNKYNLASYFKIQNKSLVLKTKRTKALGLTEKCHVFILKIKNMFLIVQLGPSIKSKFMVSTKAEL